MATIDRTSPSMFQGLSWDEWVNTVAHGAEKDAAGEDGESQEVSREEEEGHRHNDNCQVMRLKRADSTLFGICPTQDEFYLVVCEQCGKVVKPQALERHIAVPRDSLPGSRQSQPDKYGGDVAWMPEQRHGRPPGKPPDQIIPKASVMHSQPEISPLILKGLRAALEHQVDTVVGMHTVPVNSKEQDLQEEQAVATETIKQEVKGPPQFEPTQVVAHTLSRPVSPLEDPQAPTLQNVQETEVRQGGLLPQDQHDVPPTLQNELPMQHHNDERVRPVLAPVSPEVTTEVHHRAPSPMESLLDPTIAIPPQLLVKPSTISPPLVKACNQLNMPSNHKITSSGTKKQRKTPPVACLKVKNGSKEETKKSKPAKKNLPSPRKIRTGDNIPCKDREFDPNKHCGVWIEEIQRQCTRSLTCKTHALGLRRKVEGRRKPFDQLLKDHKAAKEALLAERRAMVAAQEAAKNAAKGITVTTGTTLTIPTTSLANIQPAKANTVLVAPTLMNTHSLSQQSDASKAVQKIVPIAMSSKSLNINIVNSVLPIKRPPPPCTPPNPAVALSEDLTSTPTTPITPKPMEGVAGHRIGQGDKEPVDRGGGNVVRIAAERLDSSACVQCHPRPAGMCTFGARQVGKGIYVFNRRLDHLRSTMAALVEKHLRPPPLKKMCIAADSRHLVSTSTVTTSTTSVSNMQSLTSTTTSIISRPTTCTAGSTVITTAGAARVTPGTARVTAAAGRATSAANKPATTAAKSSVVHNSVSKGQTTGKKSSAKQASANRTTKSSGNTHGGAHAPQKKARKKSGGGGGKGQNRTNASSSVVQNVFSVSSANPVVTISSAPVSNASYSFVTNSGLQAADLVGSGLVGIDASGNITDGNLLKNLQFVVTSVEANVNGGAATGTIVTHPTSGTITVPILNTTMGTTPVLLSNLGPLALQHDGKMNIKSRPQTAGVTSKSDKSRARKHSGGGAVAQTVTVTPQPMMVDNYTQDKTSGGVGVSTGVILAQPAPSPVVSSATSPMLRPDSSSPQLASPLPNGIIPSPTVAIKPFPATAAAAVNHVQSAISPSRNSTPSPGGAGSAEASPCSGVVSHQTFTGVSQSGKGGTARSGSHKSRKQQVTQQQQQQQQAVAPAPAPTQVHHLPFTTQQLLTNLVARDAQGKIVPINSALLQNHQIFNSIPVQQGPTGGAAAAAAVMQGSLTVTTATTEQGSKGTPPPPQTVIPQAIALTLQQQHLQGQPIRLQTTQGLTDQSQVVLSPNDDTRQELQLQH